MNIIAMTIKQMRQRYVSGWLTCFSVALGVGLAIAVMLMRREGAAIFGQTQYGYEVLVGAKGSSTQLVMNTVYHLDKSPGNIPYSVYDELAHSPAYRFYVKKAIPYAVGDSFKGRRIVGTIPQLFGRADDGLTVVDGGLEVRPGESYEFAEGHCFAANKFEAVIGSDVAEKHLLAIGSSFQATHGVPGPHETPDIHPEHWTVVGILKPTHTANDRAIFIPLKSFYAISEHGEGMQAIYQTQQQLAGATQASQAEVQDAEKPYAMNPDGTFTLKLPRNEWLVSAVLVKVRGPVQLLALMSAINNGKDASAVNPASVMQEFFSTFLAGSAQVLLLVSALVTLVACLGILVSIYNSVVYRRREIAIFRALGATRRRVLAITCLEAGLIGFIGSAAGIALGHLLAAIGGIFLKALIGQSIHWLLFSSEEALYLLFTTLVAIAAGLLPAWIAYRTPVAENLATS